MVSSLGSPGVPLSNTVAVPLLGAVEIERLPAVGTSKSFSRTSISTGVSLAVVAVSSTASATARTVMLTVAVLASPFTSITE